MHYQGKDCIKAMLPMWYFHLSPDSLFGFSLSVLSERMVWPSLKFTVVLHFPMYSSTRFHP